MQHEKINYKDILLKDGEGNYLLPRVYKDHLGSIIHNGLISGDDRNKWDGYNTQIENNTEAINNHTSNSSIHVTSSDKTKWNNHISDTTATLPLYHLKTSDRELLDSLYQKVYPVGCVYSSVDNVTPTFEGTTWESITSLTNPTVYRWKRTE